MKFGGKVTKRKGSAGLKAALIFWRLLGRGIRADQAVAHRSDFLVNAALFTVQKCCYYQSSN